MSFKCKIGLHSWAGCKCSECGKIRDEHHEWSNDCEKCSKCGKIRNNQHDYSKDCEKCSKCGNYRENQHNWSKDCEKCTKCGKTREGKHNWSIDCEKCSNCRKTRMKQHDWTKDCEKCSKCGKLEEHHDWSNDCEKCIKCNKTRVKKHDWSKNCEKCAKCNKTRENVHKWKHCKCKVCNTTRNKEHSWYFNTCLECGKEIPFPYISSYDRMCLLDALKGDICVSSLASILITIERKSYFEAFSTEKGICGASCKYPEPKLFRKDKFEMICPGCNRIFRSDNYNQRKCNIAVAIIGEASFKKGGLSLMREVGNEFVRRGGKSYNINSAWDGIGNWLSKLHPLSY